MIPILSDRPMDVKSRQISEHAIEVMRQRYDRLIRWHYIRILNAQRDAILALDHVPDLLEVFEVLQAFSGRQENVLSSVYRTLMPEARSMVSDGAKAWLPPMQVKAVDDVVSVRLESWIRENLGIHIQEIDRTTLDMIRALLTESTSLEEFRQGVMRVFASNPTRATTIARTETTAASNTSMQIAAEEYSFGRPVSKTWETRMTGTVRDTHRAMQGVTVAIDERFRVPRVKGGYDLMLYPGDYTGGSPENTINCRCWCSYIYDD